MIKYYIQHYNIFIKWKIFKKIVMCIIIHMRSAAYIIILRIWYNNLIIWLFIEFHYQYVFLHSTFRVFAYYYNIYFGPSYLSNYFLKFKKKFYSLRTLCGQVAIVIWVAIKFIFLFEHTYAFTNKEPDNNLIYKCCSCYYH